MSGAILLNFRHLCCFNSRFSNTASIIRSRWASRDSPSFRRLMPAVCHVRWLEMTTANFALQLIPTVLQRMIMPCGLISLILTGSPALQAVHKQYRRPSSHHLKFPRCLMARRCITTGIFLHVRTGKKDTSSACDCGVIASSPNARASASNRCWCPALIPFQQPPGCVLSRIIALSFVFCFLADHFEQQPRPNGPARIRSRTGRGREDGDPSSPAQQRLPAKWSAEQRHHQPQL